MSLRASLLAFFAQIYYRGAKVLQNSEMTKYFSDFFSSFLRGIGTCTRLILY